MSKLVFYRCPHCGNVIVKAVDSGVAVVCCGEPMQELTPKSTEEFMEKHLPVVKRDCKISSQDCFLTVQIGSVEHPMVPEHYIRFVCLETEKGFRIAHLKPGDRPCVEFCDRTDRPVAVYEYCNLHGLWKTDLS